MSINLTFHDSFAPERDAVSKLLQLASETTKPLTKEEISGLTSIPTGASSGKVVPHIKYASYMGLITTEGSSGGFSLDLTRLGQAVLTEDPYFMEDLTMYLCHYNLVHKTSEAGLWAFIFNELLPHYGRRIPNEVVTETIKQHFKKSTINLTPFRSCYTGDKSWGDTSLLEITKSHWEFSKHDVNRSFRFMYGYQLLNFWEIRFPGETEIDLPSIVNELGWGNPYLWDERDVLEALDLLADSGIVKLNRQLNPVTVIKNANSAELYGKMYSLLM